MNDDEQDAAYGPQLDEMTAELEPYTEGQVIDLHSTVRAENAELLNRMQLIGKTPTPALYTANKLDTLIDFVFGVQGEDARAAYECACDVRLNGQLREQLQHFAAQLVVPNGPAGG